MSEPFFQFFVDVFKSPKRYLIRDPTKELQLQLLQQHGYTVSDSLFFSDGNTILQQLPSITLISAPHEVTVSPVLCHQPLSRSGIVALHLEELIVVSEGRFSFEKRGASTEGREYKQLLSLRILCLNC